MKRREILGALGAVGITATLPRIALGLQAEAAPIPRKGRIRQALWPNTFGGRSQAPGPGAAPSLDSMCETAVRVGALGFDILPAESWPTLRRYGLTCTLAGPGKVDFEAGIVHPEIHDTQLAGMVANAKVCADAGVRRFGFNAGARRGLDYAKAADNAVAFLNRLKDSLEGHDVTACLENVNDRRPNNPNLARKDMVFGHWDWGMDVVARVNSPNVKLLCDIYHLQIMDGDVAWRIRESIGSIGHFHVAGVPTRNEIDGTQELNFRYIAQVIAELPYQGYVSHEWRPTPGRDPLSSIAEALAIMDV
ncbi:MAG: TIM barrel protein [Pseudomonadota bacterium]